MSNNNDAQSVKTNLKVFLFMQKMNFISNFFLDIVKTLQTC